MSDTPPIPEDLPPRLAEGEVRAGVGGMDGTAEGAKNPTSPVFAPFPPQVVDNLNAFQAAGYRADVCDFHGEVLVASPAALHCPLEDCTFAKSWAFSFQAEFSP